MDELTDLTQCPVCFEEYQLDGYRVPKILPCSHTLCEKCLETLIRNNKVDCPECRIKHQAAAGRTSFPQNKYIIAHIKTQRNEGKAHSAELPEEETTHVETMRTPVVSYGNSNPRADQISLSSSARSHTGRLHCWTTHFNGEVSCNPNSLILLRREVIFSQACVCSGGIPVAGSFLGLWYPNPSQRVPQSWPGDGGGGTPVLAKGKGVPQPGQDWGTPPPQPLDRTPQRALATRRAVCLLFSRRRTFLVGPMFSFAQFSSYTK